MQIIILVIGTNMHFLNNCSDLDYKGLFPENVARDIEAERKTSALKSRNMISQILLVPDNPNFVRYPKFIKGANLGRILSIFSIIIGQCYFKCTSLARDTIHVNTPTAFLNRIMTES